LSICNQIEIEGENLLNNVWNMRRREILNATIIKIKVCNCGFFLLCDLIVSVKVAFPHPVWIKIWK
jgi:hypothetical protein